MPGSKWTSEPTQLPSTFGLSPYASRLTFRVLPLAPCLSPALFLAISHQLSAVSSQHFRAASRLLSHSFSLLTFNRHPTPRKYFYFGYPSVDFGQ